MLDKKLAKTFCGQKCCRKFLSIFLNKKQLALNCEKSYDLTGFKCVINVITDGSHLQIVLKPVAVFSEDYFAFGDSLPTIASEWSYATTFVKNCKQHYFTSF